MDRLLEIQEVIQEIFEAREEHLDGLSEWHDIADDVVTKLHSVRTRLCPPDTPSEPPLTPSRIPNLLTPPHSSTAGSTTSEQSDSSIFNDDSYTSAAQAFDRQIYSRCVQIVENAHRVGPIEAPMITLAHHSYMSMVDEAENSEDAKKFNLWWNQFLESVEPGRPNSEKLEILDYRLVALEKLLSLDPPRRKQTSNKLLRTLVRTYKMLAVLYRPFHSKTISRLEKMAQWMDELREESEGLCEFEELVSVLKEGVELAQRDKLQYERETERKQRRISDHALCSEILTDLSIRLYKGDASPTMSHRLNNELILRINNSPTPVMHTPMSSADFSEKEGRYSQVTTELIHSDSEIEENDDESDEDEDHLVMRL